MFILSDLKHLCAVIQAGLPFLQASHSEFYFETVSLNPSPFSVDRASAAVLMLTGC
jgi:hypothetical protein